MNRPTSTGGDLLAGPPIEYPISTIDSRALPWTPALANAYAHEFPRVESLFVGNSANREHWRATIGRVLRSRDTESVSAVLLAQLQRRQAPAEALDSVASLARGGTVAVVTGQQAGLFGGPLYTLLKAVTAIQLARWVERELGTPAVPVFWVEAEDHDWAEVRRATFLDADYALKSATASDVPGAGVQPVGALRFADDDPALGVLARELPRTEFTDGVLALLQRHYRPRIGIAEAFARLMDELLGREGLVVFEANDPAAKPLVAHLFQQELQQPGRTASLVRESAAVMRSMGLKPQIEPSASAVSLFWLDEHGRHPVGRGQVDGDAPPPTPELARDQPHRFSPNVLLRPLVQDRLFPTACYVGGPSELVYQAQLREVYRSFGLEAPLLHPRLSATIIDSATVRFLERHRLSIPDLHGDEDTVLARLLEQQLPAGLDLEFSGIDDVLKARGDRLRDFVVQVDPTLGGALDTSVSHAAEAFNTLRRKVMQAAKRKSDTLTRQVKRNRALVFPSGVPQERGLSTAYFLNRHGLGLTRQLLGLSPFSAGQHHVVSL